MRFAVTLARKTTDNEQASADKIIREMGLFGADFERYEEVHAEILAAAERETELEESKVAAASGVIDKSKAKKGKIVLKSTGLTYQFQIMESIGVPRSDIKKFADPLHWLTYFPPIAIVSSYGISPCKTRYADSLPWT